MGRSSDIPAEVAQQLQDDLRVATLAFRILETRTPFPPAGEWPRRPWSALQRLDPAELARGYREAAERRLFASIRPGC